MIALDWYVPDFSNTRVSDLIEQRLPLETTEGRILFSCPTLSEFFKTSNFELDLRTGRIDTYLNPPENIGVSCQKDPFDLELLRNMLQDKQDISMAQEETLGKNPKHQETGRTSRHDEPGRSRTQDLPVLPTLATVCGHLSRTAEKVGTVTRERSCSMQSVCTLHI